MLHIIEAISERNQQTLIHLLTNGRYLSQEDYTARLAQKSNHHLLAGIPLLVMSQRFTTMLFNAKGHLIKQWPVY
jgi:hypothetical protein